MTETPDGIVAAADAEIAEAEAAVGALEDAIRDGDEKIQADDLGRAHSRLSFARLRREHAAKKAAKLAQEQAVQDAREVIEEHYAAACADPRAEVERIIRERCSEAIREAYALVSAYNAHVFNLCEGLHEAPEFVGRPTTWFQPEQPFSSRVTGPDGVEHQLVIGAEKDWQGRNTLVPGGRKLIESVFEKIIREEA